MRNDHGASGEIFETFLQRPQRVDVDVVGRFVQQQHVALLLQSEGQVQAVALAAREHAAFLLLIGAREVETGDIGAGVDLPVAQRHQVQTARDHLEDRLFGVDRLVLLVHIGQFHRGTHAERAARRSFEAHDHAEEGGLARAVRADHAHDARRGQREIQPLVQHAVAEGFRNVVRLDHHVAQTRTVGDEDFELLLFLFRILVHHLVVGRQTGLRLGVAARGRHAHPLQLAFEGLAALRLLLLLHGHARGLLVEPARVVALPRNALAAVEFENPPGDVVQKITVVGHGDHRTLVLLEMLLEPVDRLGVEVVRRLVEQQHVGLLQQQAAQGHAAALTAREVFDRLVGIGTPQGVHRALQHAVQLPAVALVDLLVQLALTLDQPGHRVVVHRLAQLLVDLLVLLQQRHGRRAALLDDLADRLRVVEPGFLFEVTHRIARREDHFAVEVLVDSGDDLHQGRLSRAVQADDADFRAVEKGEVDVVEHPFLVGEGLAYADHRKDDFFVCHILCLNCPK